MKKQAEAFLNGGKVPEDFTARNVAKEGELKGWVRERGILSVERWEEEPQALASRSA